MYSLLSTSGVHLGHWLLFCRAANNSSRDMLVKLTNAISVGLFQTKGKFILSLPTFLTVSISPPVCFPGKGDSVIFLGHVSILSKGRHRTTLLCSLSPWEACNFFWVRPQWLDPENTTLDMSSLGTGLLVGWAILLPSLPPPPAPLARKLLVPLRLLSGTTCAWGVTELLGVPAAARLVPAWYQARLPVRP